MDKLNIGDIGELLRKLEPEYKQTYLQQHPEEKWVNDLKIYRVILVLKSKTKKSGECPTIIKKPESVYFTDVLENKKKFESLADLLTYANQNEKDCLTLMYDNIHGINSVPDLIGFPKTLMKYSTEVGEVRFLYKTKDFYGDFSIHPDKKIVLKKGREVLKHRIEKMQDYFFGEPEKTPETKKEIQMAEFLKIIDQKPGLKKPTTHRMDKRISFA